MSVSPLQSFDCRSVPSCLFHSLGCCRRRFSCIAVVVLDGRCDHVDDSRLRKYPVLLSSLLSSSLLPIVVPFYFFFFFCFLFFSCYDDCDLMSEADIMKERTHVVGGMIKFTRYGGRRTLVLRVTSFPSLGWCTLAVTVAVCVGGLLVQVKMRS